MPDHPEMPRARSPNSATVPPEFDDAVVWVAWLYYADQLTQSDIAHVLGVSRATVVKLLQDARERGVVSIRLNTEAASRTTVARALAERFGLAAASVIPASGTGALVGRLGDAGARALLDQIRPDDIIGIAWGRTVLSVARAMPLPEVPLPLTVVQVYGSSAGSTAEFSPELCSSLLASRLSARCVNLLAPAVLSCADLRDRLLAEPALVKQFGLIRSASRVLFGVGDLGPGSTVRAAELATEPVIDDYRARGAIGALIGQFIDVGGRPVPGDLDSRMVGLTLDELKLIPSRLCVAGGPEKRSALRAALLGRYVTHLVTDLGTAEALLDGDADP